MNGGGSDSAAALRKQQGEQQARIEQGLGQIRNVFEGGVYGTDPVSRDKFNPAGSYFDSGGQAFVFDPKSTDYKNWLAANPGQQFSILPDPSGKGYTKVQAKPEDLKNAYIQSLIKDNKLFNKTATSSGFGPDFYNKRQQAFIDYAQPQLLQQYNQTRNNTVFKLANQGLLGGSAASTLSNALQRELGTQEQAVGNQGLALSQQLQSQVNQERSSLTAQLEASADPSTVTQQALQAASQFSAPSAFAPIGSLFNNFSNLYLGSQLAGGSSLYGSPAFRYSNPASPVGGSSFNITK